MLRQLIMKRKSVIFVLPFISLVQEKVFYFKNKNFDILIFQVKALSPFGLELNFLVEEYASNKGKYPPTKHRNCPSLYIATIEKAHSLVNSFIETNDTDRIGLLVVDEVINICAN